MTFVRVFAHSVFSNLHFLCIFFRNEVSTSCAERVLKNVAYFAGRGGSWGTELLWLHVLITAGEDSLLSQSANPVTTTTTNATTTAEPTAERHNVIICKLHPLILECNVCLRFPSQSPLLWAPLLALKTENVPRYDGNTRYPPLYVRMTFCLGSVIL